MALEALARASAAVVLVEGASDRAAVEALAARRGRDLAGEGVAVVSMGGATNIGAYLSRLVPAGADRRLAGLCDAGEVHVFGRALERAGFGRGLDRAGLEALGFHVCDADLEDELIRSLGLEAVEAVIASLGELASFRTMQQQPAQRNRRRDQQLRRFMGTRGGRKIRYASALVDALDPARVPLPLDRLLAAV
jgi:hypothetical protein